MYICVCKSMTSAQLRQRFEEGDDTVKKIVVGTGVGVECGCCCRTIADELSKFKQDNQALTSTKKFGPR